MTDSWLCKVREEILGPVITERSSSPNSPRVTWGRTRLKALQTGEQGLTFTPWTLLFSVRAVDTADHSLGLRTEWSWSL